MLASAFLLLIASGIAAMGFLVMRNPMLFVSLAPGAEGYYQRMVLDRHQRNQLRMLGMICSFFGLAMLTDVLSSRLSARIFGTISDGMLVLLSLSFASAFMFGITYTVVQLFRGRWKELFSDWFNIYRQGMELGPIDVSPTITPRMRRESIAFTVIYCSLIGLTLVVALVAR
jgi:hypothetical protein